MTTAQFWINGEQVTLRDEQVHEFRRTDLSGMTIDEKFDLVKEIASANDRGTGGLRMTSIHTFQDTIEQLQEYLDSKENPEEWYVVRGQCVGEYSVWDDVETDEDYEQWQAEAPPDERDANPNVEGFVQIGSLGWTGRAFDFGESKDNFVSEVQWGDKIEKRIMGMLVVHESALSDEALTVAEEGPEAVEQ